MTSDVLFVTCRWWVCQDVTSAIVFIVNVILVGSAGGTTQRGGVVSSFVKKTDLRVTKWFGFFRLGGLGPVPHSHFATVRMFLISNMTERTVKRCLAVV